MKKIILLITLLFISGCVSQSNRQPTAILGNTTINLELAKTNYERNIGLSAYYTLSIDWGMLFLFDDYGERRFYMKDMRFPIDILWLDENMTVTKILENAQPCKNGCETFLGNAKYVLEINAGIAKENNLSVGSKIQIANVFEN